MLLTEDPDFIAVRQTAQGILADFGSLLRSAGLRPAFAALPAGDLLFNFDATTGVSVSSNCTVAADTLNKAEGTGSLKLTGNGTGTSVFMSKTGLATRTPAELGVIAVHANIQTPKLVTGYDFQMRKAGDPTWYTAGGASSVSLTDGTTAGAVLPGGRWFAWNVSEISTFGADLTSGALEIRFFANCASGAAPVASFDALVANAKGRPELCLTFDDAEETIYTRVFPRMSERGLVGTIYVPTAFVGTTGKLTWAMIDKLYAAGWAVACDGTSDDTSMTAKSSISAMMADLNAIRSTLATRGYVRGLNHLCYPNGTFHAGTDAVADPFYLGKIQTALKADGYLTARTVLGGSMHCRFGFADQALALPGQGYSSTSAAAALSSFQTHLDLAVKRGTLLTPYIHKVRAGGSASGSIDLDTVAFESMLDYAVAYQSKGQLDIITIDDVWTRHGTAAFSLG